MPALTTPATTMNEFKWSIENVEDLLKGTKHLIGSIKHSSFDNNELLLNKPYFIHNLLLQAIAELPPDDNDNKDRGLYASVNNDTTSINTWKEIIGNLRWLLNQSLMYNYNSNDDNEASLYFSKNIQQLPADGGGKKDIASNTLGEMIKWFPELALEQIRRNVNYATFLVENVTPGDAHRDVELSSVNRVLTWISFNHQSSKEKILLKTLDPQTKGAELQRIVPVRNIHPRYGLKFEQKEENVYKVVDIKNNYLRSRGANIVLTITFLVGRFSPPRNTDNNDNDTATADNGAGTNVDSNNDDNDNDNGWCENESDNEDIEDDEQFILNDFHYSEMHKQI